MSRSRRIIKLKGNSYYNGFEIKQAPSKPEKLGIGSYILTYKDKEILRQPLHSDCREKLEKLVREKRVLTERSAG